MREISKEQVIARLRTDNPWWGLGEIGEALKAMRPRACFRPLLSPGKGDGSEACAGPHGSATGRPELRRWHAPGAPVRDLPE